MRKSVQLTMLLGVITLSMVSCDKDDNQLQIKKEVKANGVDEQEVDHDWGHPPIKPPKFAKLINNVNEDQEVDHDYGHTPIKPPKYARNITEEMDNNDLGNTTIKPPKRNQQVSNHSSEQEIIDWGNTPIKRPK